VPQLEPQPRPISLAVKRCLARFLDVLPHRHDQWVRILETQLAVLNSGGRHSSRLGGTPGPRRVGATSLARRGGTNTGHHNLLLASQRSSASFRLVATSRRHAGAGSAEVRRESTPTPTDPLG